MTPVRLSPEFGKAMIYALFLHGGQERKGSGVPYMGHLLGTAGIVLHYGGDEEQGIAALLHDAAEDQGGRSALRAIEARFGARVARIVEGCTDTFERPKPPWRPRKEAYLERLPTEPEETLLVSAADKLDNARAIVMDVRALGGRNQNEFWNRFNGKKKGTLWYYAELAKAYREAGLGPLSAEFLATVEEMHRLAGASTGQLRSSR